MGKTDWPAAPVPLAAPVIDSHTHLDVIDRNLHGDDGDNSNFLMSDFLLSDFLLSEALKVGVNRLVQVGCDVASSAWAAQCAETHSEVIATVALHPNVAPQLAERGELDHAWQQIAELARNERVRGIGETGLDYFRTGEEGRKAQHDSFRWHIDLARELNKTLVIHDRDSHEDVLRVLQDQGAPERVVFHCFSGDASMARICADNGWYMSFAGVITFKNAQSLRDALAVVPDSLLLVETDAPYLTPVPNRGKVNASYLMPYTVREIARLRETPEADVCNLLTENAFRAFGHW